MNISKHFPWSDVVIDGQNKDILILFPDEKGMEIDGNVRTTWKKCHFFIGIPLNKRSAFLAELRDLHKKYLSS